MDARKENGWRSVPEFGGWDHNAPGASNYSVVFTQARANRKQQKTDLTEFKRSSLGNERELMAAAGHQQKHRHQHRHRHEHQNQHRRHHHHQHHHQAAADDSIAVSTFISITLVSESDLQLPNQNL
ncbi:lateral signaling target protein 2 homolog [Momordica charantia]|uniref:Lateral signaling target protein 2 homolog n=1 Tax=Momordica charantia TaxID=3673 RepID=A0A6J1DJD7_MOMCH|nr:lateral signaling target protein 2 homolog [Momordica charantia]